MHPNATNGVHVKQFLNDPTGGAWVAKSGALNEPFLPTHTPAVERGRRVAFPLNEALASLIYPKAGIKTNEVALGLRTMFVRPTGTWEPLLTSFHRMQTGWLRDHVQFERTSRYLEDLLCMACIDIILGQRDHKPHNYLVTPELDLFLFDNSDCMYQDWLAAPCDPDLFETVWTYEPSRPVWTDATRAATATRVTAITPDFIDEVFATIPIEFRRAHDTCIDAGPYAAGSMLQKQERIKTNLEVFNRWASRSRC